MLTQTLRAMERDGLVGRRVHPEVPPRVEYALTPLGATLAGPLRALGAWSVAHGKHVEEARGRFEERARAKTAAARSAAERQRRLGRAGSERACVYLRIGGQCDSSLNRSSSGGRTSAAAPDPLPQ